MDIQHYQQQYQQTLAENIIPFWLQHSKDDQHGGYFTCLLRNGDVFDRDKFIWLQARQVWTFAMLYNRLEAKQEWLHFAEHGAHFLAQYGRDRDWQWYFSLNQSGQPLVQPYNIFSDCFATMAFGQLYLATKDQQQADIAVQTFEHILQRQTNPKGIYNKLVPGTRPLKNFALPMILSNLCLEIESLLDPALVSNTIDQCIHEVMEVFYHQESGLILENVTPEGAFSDTFDGRLLNPGHAIEAMWFMMDLGVRLKDTALIEKAKDRTLHILEYGWDKDHGGIFYFMDLKGHPTQQLEWDQKLWWVHLETLIALLVGYQLTQDERCWQWFEKVHDYAWNTFHDPQYGEWFGYANRRGEILLPLKGGKWKGCFHVPRGMFRCAEALHAISLLN